MPKAETVDKFFEAVNDAYETLLDAMKSGSDRGYRVSKRLIEEAERSQREAIELTHRLAKSPRDVTGFYGATVRSLTDAQGRVLELTRALIDEVVETQQEARESLQRVIEANRTAGQAAIEGAREVVGRAGRIARPGRGGNGRREQAEPKTPRPRTRAAKTETEA